MSARWLPERVLVYRHPVDMRKQIDGLSELVAAELDQDPSDRTAYVFVSRCSRRVKVLIWHLNGYWLLYKRVENQRTGPIGLVKTRPSSWIRSSWTTCLMATI